MDNSEITYTLDTCALLTLESFYPRDLFPQIWVRLDELFKIGKARIIEDVYKELSRRDDEVFNWIKERKSYAVRPQTEKEFLKAKEIINIHPDWISVDATQTIADPFVIADAVCNDVVVVTREDLAGSGAKKTKIPNVCAENSVRCIGGQYFATEFFRENGWAF